ncbi:hypothetical protein CCR75_006622 [Bremia lactucae]|uniref:Uncharacterized protein n=1 Tax=Bremia lactucae TaxID=4779 RepID=A0A976FIF9_BRELC|nr:hypothetical protein CCR75_006622 [Bremia lactucae]
MDLVSRLLDYIATFPRHEDENELKSQLSGCTQKDLRAACTSLQLPVPKKSSKKSGYITTLVSYWKGDLKPGTATAPTNKRKRTSCEKTLTKPNLPHHPMSVHEASDVIEYIHEFRRYEDVEELRDQLNGCKAMILRSACVQLDLRPNQRDFVKPNYVDLLVEYWKDTQEVGFKPPVTPEVSVLSVKESGFVPDISKDEVESQLKRIRDKAPLDEETMIDLEKRRDNKKTSGNLTALLEKAKVVKEWASAIEVLSRVDGSQASIASIRALIHGVVKSAATDAIESSIRAGKS